MSESMKPIMYQKRVTDQRGAWMPWWEINKAAYDDTRAHGDPTVTEVRALYAIDTDTHMIAPVEPTPTMCAAGFCVSEAEHDPAGVYRAMLAAAPGNEGE